MAADAAPDGRAGLAKPTRVLLTLAAAGLTAWAVSAGRDILAPFLLATVLVIVAHPVRRPLDRRGAPGWVGTAAVVATVYAIIVGLAVVITLALGQFARVLGSYGDQLDAARASFEAFLHSLGFDADSAAGLASGVDPGAFLHALFAAGQHLLGFGTALFFVAGYAIYLAMDGARFRRLPASLAGEHSLRVRSFQAFAAGTSRYYVVNSVFGALVALIDGVALAVIGVPAAFAWAVLAFVTNYIPNIGFVIGLIPPFVLALVTGGWGQALLVLAVYCIVNVALQVFVQPRFVAVSVNLSFTLTFAAVVVWAFLLGPIGSILAIPLTLLVRFALIGHDPDARLARWLTGEPEPPGPGPESSAG